MERSGLGIAEEERDFGDARAGVAEQRNREVVADLILNLAERCAFGGQPPTERPLAQSHLATDHLRRLGFLPHSVDPQPAHARGG